MSVFERFKAFVKNQAAENERLVNANAALAAERDELKRDLKGHAAAKAQLVSERDAALAKVAEWESLANEISPAPAPGPRAHSAGRSRA